MQGRVTERTIPKSYSPYCLFLYQMLQVLVTSDALQLVLDYLLNIFLDLVVVVLNGFFMQSLPSASLKSLMMGIG